MKYLVYQIVAKAAVRDAKDKLENESQEVIDLVEALS